MAGLIYGVTLSSVVFSLLIGYLIGSTPFGLIVTRLAGLGDVRKIGSGNIGATNVLRTGRKGLAALTLLGDLGKGAAGVLVASSLFGPVGAVAGGVGAFLGHLYPFWLRFRGGKGVATYIGVVAAWYWPAALVFCGVWLAVAVASRMSSLAALTASLAAPAVIGFFHHDIAMLIAVLAMTALLYVRHRDNISRLLAGRESRIGENS